MLQWVPLLQQAQLSSQQESGWPQHLCRAGAATGVQITIGAWSPATVTHLDLLRQLPLVGSMLFSADPCEGAGAWES